MGSYGRLRGEWVKLIKLMKLVECPPKCIFKNGSGLNEKNDGFLAS